MPLLEVIRAVTVNPAKVIGESGRLGSLSIGNQANISIFEKKKGPWTLLDGRNEVLDVDMRLIPWLTFRDGVSYLPNLAMLPDLLINQSERIVEAA
jgi:predicted amidohydrolase